MRGLFITFEGGDGSGKSTQMNRLAEYLEGRGCDVLMTREPGGTAIGEKIRDIILDVNNMEMTPAAEALLYAASRAQHVKEVIKPAIERGRVVICDRYVDSSFAYQGYGRGLGDWVRLINDPAVDGIMPDITFLMKLEPGQGKRRIHGRKEDRIETEEMDFHERVYRGYEILEAENGGRIFGIDASRDAEEITAEIISVIEEFENGGE